MRIDTPPETKALARHLRDLREQAGLTLAIVADRSGVSRASLSRIENAGVSPTAETLGRLASVYALPMSQLLSPLDHGFQPVLRQAEQPQWHDPEKDFQRRNVSPSNGPLTVELIEGQLGPAQHIRYPAPAISGQEHHLYVLSGEIDITVDGTLYPLRVGDCLRYILRSETVFKTTHTPCRYVIALK